MSDNNLVIIDADSIIYIIGYELENMFLEPMGAMKLDDFIKNILITTGAKEYLGFFGGDSGRNFRKDVAVTKEYKGNRAKEKPEWFDFWAPVLKDRMRDYWGFQSCENIEADDACCVAANLYRGKYAKVIVASPDKDLYQIPDMDFYDYGKRYSVFCNADTSKQLLVKQLILGDSTDAIPGLPGAGKVVAEKFVLEAVKKPEDLILQVEEFYTYWFAVVMRNAAAKKQEKEFLKQYKIENNIKVLKKAAKSDALASFKVDTTELRLDEDSIAEYYKEMYTLLKLLDTEEEAAEHGFVLITPIVDNKVDWSTIIQYQDELDDINDDEELLFEELL